MNSELITQIFEICILPLLAVVTGYLVQLIKVKSAEINAQTDNAIAQKYNTLIADTVTKCVIATNQTYVDSLKKSGNFDAVAQKVAFDKTLEAVMTILSEDAKVYIQETTGDIAVYLTSCIEATVKTEK